MQSNNPRKNKLATSQFTQQRSTKSPVNKFVTSRGKPTTAPKAAAAQAAASNAGPEESKDGS